MKTRVILALIFCFIATSVRAEVYEAGKLYGPTHGGPLSRFIVVIDPGHGGVDPGGAHWFLDDAEYWESAYTYRMASEAADIIRDHGGSTVCTLSSRKSMTKDRVAQEAIPEADDAHFAGGHVYRGTKDLGRRVSAVNKVYDDYFDKAKYDYVICISLHIDSMPKGYQGLHVIRGRKDRDLPGLIENAILAGHYARTFKGQIKHPLDYKPSLAMLNPNKVRLANVVIVEMGCPGEPNDSWRLRFGPSRRHVIHDVVLLPLIALAKGIASEAFDETAFERLDAEYPSPEESVLAKLAKERAKQAKPSSKKSSAKPMKTTVEETRAMNTTTEPAVIQTSRPWWLFWVKWWFLGLVSATAVTFAHWKAGAKVRLCAVLFWPITLVAMCWDIATAIYMVAKENKKQRVQHR